MHVTSLALLTLLLTTGIGQACASDNEQQTLALALAQITQIESTFERSRLAADTQVGQRFFFNYPQLALDLELIRAGIEQYLSPERAQPREPARLRGNYCTDQWQP